MRSLVHFGGHTHSHVILSRVDEEKMDEEIRICRERIATETSAPPTLFAYPNGQPGDYGEPAKQALLRHGFATAFSAIEGLNGMDTDWMAVRRFSPAGSTADLAWPLTGLSRRPSHRHAVG